MMCDKLSHIPGGRRPTSFGMLCSSRIAIVAAVVLVVAVVAVNADTYTNTAADADAPQAVRRLLAAPGKPEADPAVKSPAEAAAKPAAKPHAKPAAKPPAQPTAKPIAKPVAKPGAKPAAKPVAKPAAKPVAKPAAKPGTDGAVHAKPTAKPAAKRSIEQAAAVKAAEKTQKEAQARAMISAWLKKKTTFSATKGAAAVTKPVKEQPEIVLPPPRNDAPMCEWRNDLGRCMVGRHYPLSLDVKQDSWISKKVTSLAARDYLCSRATTADVCINNAPAGQSCIWEPAGPAGTDVGCRHSVSQEWSTFAAAALEGWQVPGIPGPAAPPGSGAVAAALKTLSTLQGWVCKGSKAAASQQCPNIYPLGRNGMAAPQLCQKGVGCVFTAGDHSTGPMCDTSPAATTLLYKYHTDFVGKCVGMCYLKLLDTCAAAAAQEDGRQAWCSKQPGCRWAAGSCKPDIYMGNVGKWGLAMRQATDICSAQKTERSCGAADASANPVDQKLVQQFKAGDLGPGGDMRCPV